jgi:hypothetical protein
MIYRSTVNFYEIVDALAELDFHAVRITQTGRHGELEYRNNGHRLTVLLDEWPTEEVSLDTAGLTPEIRDVLMDKLRLYASP